MSKYTTGFNGSRKRVSLHRTAIALGAGLSLLVGVASPALAEEVEFMNWTYTEDAGKQAMVDMFDGFAAQGQNTVKPLGYAWKDMTKNTFLRARTNSLPDVSQVQARLLPTLANIESIVDFNDVLGKEKLAELFSPAFLGMGEVGGKQVALPWVGGTIGMVANKKVMEAAGIDSMPVTLAEFRAALVKVRDQVPNSVPYTMATKNNDSIVLDYLIWVWTHGGDVVVDGKAQVNSPEATAALAFMVDLMENRLAAPEIDRPDARRLFAQESSAFYFDAPSAKGFAMDFSGQGEAYVPNVMPVKTPVLKEGDDPVSIQWGHVLAMYGDENASADSAATDFVMYVLSDDVLIDFALSKGVLPATLSGQASAKVQNDGFLAAWAKGAVAPRRNTIASLDNGAEVGGIIGEEVQAALLKQKTAEQAANDMQARLEKVL